ncbi:hypothetical protein LVJ94_40990 [Pendulispora rubella]|uniref:Uncharacterized protein n=1 Tax=Pendulispora rubella TaxID=2741070 RepID=A0ABZ2L3P7_9BACT
MRFWTVLLCLSALGGVASTTCRPSSESRAPAPVAAGGHSVVSNVTRDDYAGSAACEPCHADIHAAWQASAMHQMTRPAKDARILAPFDGTVFRFKEDTARLDRVGVERFVSITSPRYGDHKYRVTKVIGGHYREDFAGVDVSRPSALKVGPGEPGTSGDELVLPVSYVYKRKELRYKGYSVMLPERDGLRAGPVWQKTCIFCHNTAPYLSSFLGAIAGPAARGYQGEVVDPLLPKEKRWNFVVTDDAAFRRVLAKEVDVLHGSASGESWDDLAPPQAAARAVVATRENFGERHLIEVGIGCESCHGGSKEHVSNPRVHPTFEPRAPFLRMAKQGEPPSREELVNRTCARCHQVLFSGYGHTWEGGTRQRGAVNGPGGSNINSGEARDMLLGACRISCVPCHEPHTRESGGRTRDLDSGHAGNAMCTSCHAKLESREALRAHAKHDPNGEGGRCIACHMPKKNMSLDGTLTRYHRIGSPLDPVRVERDRPLECALCHTNKSVATLLSDVQRLYGKRYDEARLHALYPDWTQNALVATLESGKPHEQAVAMHLLGEMHFRDAAQSIARQMVHPVPIVRGYAERALESILGSSSPVDLHSDNLTIEAATRAWLAAPPKSGATTGR